MLGSTHSVGLLRSLVDELFDLRDVLLQGCPGVPEWASVFSNNLSASFSRCLTLAPAAWTADSTRPSPTINTAERDRIRDMLESGAVSNGEWKALT